MEKLAQFDSKLGNSEICSEAASVYIVMQRTMKYNNILRNTSFCLKKKQFPPQVEYWP